MCHHKNLSPIEHVSVHVLDMHNAYTCTIHCTIIIIVLRVYVLSSLLMHSQKYTYFDIFFGSRDTPQKNNLGIFLFKCFNYSKPHLTRSSGETKNGSSYLGVRVNRGRVFLDILQVTSTPGIQFIPLASHATSHSCVTIVIKLLSG